jgi:hypothetical protein
LDSSWAF